MMNVSLERDGLYATFRGSRYPLNQDTQGRLVITTQDPASRDLGFVDRYGVGTYTRVVEPDEVTDVQRTLHVGSYRGEQAQLTVNARGGVLVGTSDVRLATRLGLPRIDKAWWESEVAADDPELDIRELREPADGNGSPS